MKYGELQTRWFRGSQTYSNLSGISMVATSRIRSASVRREANDTIVIENFRDNETHGS